ncbi:MAG TPA: hypothetical protein VNT27_03600, partial [Propionibacteriaceae bacterium]|nr:hypothetical protein [Propionibacteriaceae bacterium]
ACPCSAYHTVTTLKQISPNGTVRSTAGRVRLRASPTPTIWRASAKAYRRRRLGGLIEFQQVA